MGNEERSKHGYEIVQYMAYKLNGTEHNIHKSSHYNTVEQFDQIKQNKSVGSNHCDKQYNLEMKTSLLTGCYQLFNIQNNQINKQNNIKNQDDDGDEKDEEVNDQQINDSDQSDNNDDKKKEINWTQRDVKQQLDTMIDEA